MVLVKAILAVVAMLFIRRCAVRLAHLRQLLTAPRAVDLGRIVCPSKDAYAVSRELLSKYQRTPSALPNKLTWSLEVWKQLGEPSSAVGFMVVDPEVAAIETVTFLRTKGYASEIVRPVCDQTVVSSVAFAGWVIMFFLPEGRALL